MTLNQAPSTIKTPTVPTVPKPQMDSQSFNRQQSSQGSNLPRPPQPPGQVSSGGMTVPAPPSFPSLQKQSFFPSGRVSKPKPSSSGSFGRVVEQKGGEKRALAKLGVFLLIVLLFGTTATVLITKFFTQKARWAKKGVLFSSELKQTLWQSFGNVPEAELSLPIQGPEGEKQQQAFLLDTGAVVSSLPREMAQEMGYNLAFLPRQTFKGFGNTTSFAYQAEMDIFLGEKQVKLPVVFTEAEGSKALLGRKGLFDKFSIIIDHKNKVVEIRE